MAVVVAFLRGVDADPHLEDDRLAAALRGCRDGHGARFRVLQVAELEGLAPGEAEALRVLALRELAGEHAHADQVGTMDTLEALGDHRLDAEQHGALRRPVARRPGAVFLARQDHQRRAGLLVPHRCVVDRQLFAGRDVHGDSALGAGSQQVAQADVGEGATHHHLVVAAARTVGVEVGFLHALRFEVERRRAAACDVACGRDVVGGDRVPEQGERARALDAAHLARLHGHAIEVGRVADVGGVVRPRIELAGGYGDALPVLVAGEHVAIAALEHLRVDGIPHGVGDFLRTRPDVAEIDRLAVPTRAERFGVEVDVRGAGEREGHDQRRRGKEVHLHFRVHAPLEIAVARQHRGGDHVTLLHGGGDLGLEGARVADAGHATVAGDVEAHGFVVVEQLGFLEVVGDHLGAGRKRGLDPGLGFEAGARGIAREQRGAEHHRRVGGVGAARDGGDQDSAVLHFVSNAAGDRSGARGARVLPGALLGHLAQGLAVDLLDLGQGHPILRPLGAGQRRHHGAHVQFEDVRVVGLRGAVVAPHALRLGIGFDQGDLLLRATRELEVAQGFLVDREDAAGAAVFRRHVGDGGAVRQRQVGEAVAEVLDELLDHALLAQDLGDGEHEVGGGGARRQLARELEAHDLRDEHGDRLAEHGGLGLDAADAPAQHAEAVDHGGVRVGAHQRVRVGLRLAPVLVFEHDTAQVLEVDLVHDAGAWRHDLEVLECGLAPAQERVAFAVALEFDPGVARQGTGGAVVIGLDGVVDDQFRRGEGIDLPRVTAELADRLAHRGEVDHAGHAREVLHDHAGGGEGDFMGRGSLGLPVEEGLDVLARDVHAILEAEQVLQQDLQRVGQPRDLVLRQCRQAPDIVLARADLELLAGLEAVRHESSGEMQAAGERPWQNPIISLAPHALHRRMGGRCVRSRRRRGSACPSRSPSTGPA